MAHLMMAALPTPASITPARTRAQTLELPISGRNQAEMNTVLFSEPLQTQATSSSEIVQQLERQMRELQASSNPSLEEQYQLSLVQQRLLALKFGSCPPVQFPQPTKTVEALQRSPVLTQKSLDLAQKMPESATTQRSETKTRLSPNPTQRNLDMTTSKQPDVVLPPPRSPELKPELLCGRKSPDPIQRTLEASVDGMTKVNDITILRSPDVTQKSPEHTKRLLESTQKLPDVTHVSTTTSTNDPIIAKAPLTTQEESKKSEREKLKAAIRSSRTLIGAAIQTSVEKKNLKVDSEQGAAM